MNKEIRELIALDSGDYDQWGWANSHMFAIYDVLYANGEGVPASWEYVNPWPRDRVLEGLDASRLAEEWPGHEYLWLYDGEEITADDLRRAGEVLIRYLRLLKRAGKDY